MSSCVLANRKFVLINERIFYGLPGIILGFCAQEFIGRISSSYGYVATIWMLATAVISIFGVTVRWRKQLKWFLFVVLIANVVASIVYLVIAIEAESDILLVNITGNGTDTSNDLTTNHLNLTNYTNTSEIRNGSFLNETDANGLGIPAHESGSQRIKIHGLKAPIAFIVLSVLLLLNGIAAYKIQITVVEENTQETPEGAEATSDPLVKEAKVPPVASEGDTINVELLPK